MGADNVMTGLETMWTGESQATRLFRVINALGEEAALYGSQGAANIEKVLNLTSLVNPRAFMLLGYRIGIGIPKPRPLFNAREIVFEVDSVERSLERVNRNISIQNQQAFSSNVRGHARNNFNISSRLKSSPSPFTPAFNETRSFSTRSVLDGELYPKNKLSMLINYLEKRGTYVYGTIGDPYFTGRRNGALQLYFPERPTILQVKHELSHWLDFRRLGYEEYSKLSVYQREKMVLERLQENRIWKDLNQFEKDFSVCKRFFGRLR